MLASASYAFSLTLFLTAHLFPFTPYLLSLSSLRSCFQYLTCFALNRRQEILTTRHFG